MKVPLIRHAFGMTPSPASGRRGRSSLSRLRERVGCGATRVRALLATALFAVAVSSAPAQTLLIQGDSIPAPLTAEPGDPARGRAIAASRQKGLCILCHSGPFPEERFQGNLAPDMRGAGSRWNAGQLRLRIADSRRLNPETIMPSYFASEGFERVGAPWRGKSVLTASEIEDVVAYLLTLRE